MCFVLLFCNISSILELRIIFDFKSLLAPYPILKFIKQKSYFTTKTSHATTLKLFCVWDLSYVKTYKLNTMLMLLKNFISVVKIW